MYKRGFTLVELLIVITIILFIIALVIPSVAMIQAKANQVKCANNMKQIGTAFLTYATDYNSKLPSAVFRADKYGSWLNGEGGRDEEAIKTGGIYSYLQNPLAYLCPTDDGPVDPVTGDIVDPICSYTMNMKVSRRSPAMNPGLVSKIIVLVEESGETILDPPSGGGDENLGAFEKTDRVALRHSDHCNVLYLDWRVEPIKLDEAVTADDDIFGVKREDLIKDE